MVRGRAFAVSVPRTSGQTVVKLEGEHDIATVDLLARALAKARAVDNADLVVDLDDVDFLGAAAVHVLRHTRALLHRQGRTMTLRLPSKCVRRMLSLCDVALSDPDSRARVL
jgi:anti-anti-sigma factor